jgi:outer membrane protein assembly factor BamB
MNASGVKGGLVVHLGCGDGKLTASLRLNDSYLIHGLDSDKANMELAREYIHSLGLYGDVSVEYFDDRSLPYADNLVNLIVAEETDVSRDELMRVLVPNGVAYIRENGEWKKWVKPWPKEMGEWTHYLGDATGNAVAKDTLIGPPRYMQWVAKPMYSRSHEIDSSVSALVSANGRIFYILDEGLTGITDERLPENWVLVARDAFNGVLLWKRYLPDWGWPQWKKDVLAGKDWTELRGQRISSPKELPRRLVADGERVYITLGYTAPLTALDAATGEVIKTYEGTEETDEILYSDGILILCIRKHNAEAAERRGESVPESIMAVKADTGEIMWKRDEAGVLPLSLAMKDNRVFLHNYDAIISLDAETGEELWQTPMAGAKGNKWAAVATLVAYDNFVFFADNRKLVALSSDNGKIVWTGPGGQGPGIANPVDLFVANGMVWCGGYETERERKTTNRNTHVRKSGYDPKTGQVNKVVEVENLIAPGHHFRCYRSKATENYLLWTKRGVEFIDLKSDNHQRHDWLRATCKLGFTPSNGLLYIPPHQCFCYAGVKLGGLNALASGKMPKPENSEERLERGKAYGQVEYETASEKDVWHTFRHDPKRSGSTSSRISENATKLWEMELNGKITQPVAAAGKVFVAAIDSHTLYCLDAENGKTLWEYTAGGRVDSPPTFYNGMVLFGSADGYAYCLRGSDGELMWRFRGAPEERRIIAFGQLESAWTIHGSVLVKDDVAYFAAGRSSYLDGGIYVYGLDPRTGEVLHENRIEGPYPDPAKDIGRPFDMEGTKSDVLVTDGKYLYMQQAMLDGNLEEIEAPRITNMGDRRMGMHIFSTAGLLDNSGWNRTFWMYSERWPGFYIANQSPKSGQLLVFDDTTTYGVKCYTRRNRHSPMFFPGTDGYLLFADDNNNEPSLVDKNGEPRPVKWLPDIPEKIGHELDGVAVDRDKGTGFTRTNLPKWSVWVPIRVQAMVHAGEKLFIAGPPDVLDPEDPTAAFRGIKGGILWAVSAEDGSKLVEYKLESPPVFDGMIAAYGRLYMSMTDGKLLCYGSK